MKVFFLVLLAYSARLSSSAPQWINENASFESSGSDWNFQPVVGEPSNADPIQFLQDPTSSRLGSGYCLMTLWEGAYFPPASVRMGQSVLLKKDHLYSVVVWARVNRGTKISGNDGAIVSTFCQASNGEGFIGKDTTLNAINSLEKDDYSRIQFNIVGDDNIWDCYIGLLGQPTSDNPPKEVQMYIDDYRVWEMKEIEPPMETEDALADAGFDQALSVIQYGGGNGPQFNGDTPWHLDYNRFFRDSSIPFLQGGRLWMKLPEDRNVLEFLGVFQKVDLKQGQKYRLQVDYTRETPTNLPSGAGVSIFNYYVRLPDSGGPNQPHIRNTEGLLLGEVDVRVYNEPSGTSSVTFVAPRTTTYEVVLKMSAYGNRNLKTYEMSFDNAKLIPIND